MTIKIPKAEAVEKITALRKLGLTTRQIGERIGLGKTRVCQIIKDFSIPGNDVDKGLRGG